LDNPCPFLDKGKCKLHGKIEQPGCCKRNVAGGWFCLKKRSEMDDNYL
jgi:hypothetical protein